MEKIQFGKVDSNLDFLSCYETVNFDLKFWLHPKLLCTLERNEVSPQPCLEKKNCWSFKGSRLKLSNAEDSYFNNHKA